MFYFSKAAFVKGEGSVNVGLFLFEVISSMSTMLYSFWLFFDIVHACFYFFVGGGRGDPWYG